MNGIISIFALSIVGTICAVGVFHHEYPDSLGERVGMSLIAIWCFARVGAKLVQPETEPVHLMLHSGLVIFACSHAYAKWKVRRNRHQNWGANQQH